MQQALADIAPRLNCRILLLFCCGSCGPQGGVANAYVLTPSLSALPHAHARDDRPSCHVWKPRVGRKDYNRG